MARTERWIGVPHPKHCFCSDCMTTWGEWQARQRELAELAIHQRELNELAARDPEQDARADFAAWVEQQS